MEKTKHELKLERVNKKLKAKRALNKAYLHRYRLENAEILSERRKKEYRRTHAFCSKYELFAIISECYDILREVHGRKLGGENSKLQERIHASLARMEKPAWMAKVLESENEKPRKNQEVQ